MDHLCQECQNVIVNLNDAELLKWLEDLENDLVEYENEEPMENDTGMLFYLEEQLGTSRKNTAEFVSTTTTSMQALPGLQQKAGSYPTSPTVQINRNPRVLREVSAPDGQKWVQSSTNTEYMQFQ